MHDLDFSATNKKHTLQDGMHRDMSCPYKRPLHCILTVFIL